MDKLSSINIVGVAKAGNSFEGNISTNSSNNSHNQNGQQNAARDAGDTDVETLQNASSTTISAPEVHRVDCGPDIQVPKTEPTTGTLITDVETDDLSNKNMEKCDANVNRLNNAANQGRKNKLSQNEGAQAASSTRHVAKAIMSESLYNLLAYGSSSEDSEKDSVHSLSEIDYTDSDEENEGGVRKQAPTGNKITNTEKYRENKEDDSSDSSDTDESSGRESNLGARSEPTAQRKKRNLRTAGELELADLPPVPDLSKLDINLKAEDCIHMGNVTSIVDTLVTIQSLPNTPAYDLDTLLFIDQGRRPLGHVYDVLGQVTSPMYVVRFNSKEEIESKGIAKGLPVYSAPNTHHTQYVFLKELMKIKGSDASWKGDNEVPPEFMDFSDDEAEYTFTKQTLNEQDMFDNKRKRNSVEKHKLFENAMNLKNKVDTARQKMRDSIESAQTQKRYVPPTTHPSVFYHQPPPVNHQMRQQCSTSFTNFPPPNFGPVPSSFGYINIPPMLGMPPPFINQFAPGMPPFPPNPQPFPPGTFGPPAIPPLPAMPPHVLPQPQPPPFSANMTVLPPNMSIPKQQLNVPKSPKTLKTPHNGGVVPKAQSTSGPKTRSTGLPKLYIPPAGNEYQQPYPPNLGLPKSTVPPFATNPPPNMPMSMPPPFGPPMPPWPYNLPRPPHNVRGFQLLRNGGKHFKK